MIEGKTKSGFEFKLDEEVFNDYELLEALREVDAGDGSAIVDVINRMLDETQRKALKNHLRNEKGRVGAREMIAEVAEIMKASKDGKNS